jgi:hypothetical protein
MKYRHELKYVISYQEHALIRSRVQTLLSRDKNVGSDGTYTVRSLYFDDFYNNAYDEKYAGILSRAKHRIRIYNYSDKRITFEKKNKQGAYNWKQSAQMTKEQVYGVIQGDYSHLLRSADNLLMGFYYECTTNVMRPRIIVDYEREPYTMEAGDVRITFDKNLRAGADGFNIFDSKIPTVEIMRPNFLVMEVKFTEFLPSIVRDILPSAAANYMSVSKYILCCDRMLHIRNSNF